MSKQAQIVVVGAGIVGCSAAYYLAEYGCTDVIVIDKGALFENDGSTSHAPGGVNPLSNNPAMARLAGDTIDLFETLPLWKPDRKPLYMVGGLDVARTADRMDEVRRLYTNAKGFGVDAHIITPKEIEQLFPLMRGDLFVGGLHTPRKPIVAGTHVCGALATAAQKKGIQFISHTKATDFILENGENGRIIAIKTNNPDYEQITCDRVLVCTNIWTPALMSKVGVNIPLMAAEHQYLKSEPLPELAHVSDRNNREQEVIYPSVRDMDGGLYYRHWWDSLGVGNYHHRPIMRESSVLGESADHPFTPDDFVDAQKIAVESIPALSGRSFPYKINGMFSFSVDGLPILGETNVDGLWVATAVWITNSGGVGKAMAQWMLTGAAEVDMRSLNVNRFLPYQKTRHFRHIACTKSYVEVHDVIHPAQSPSKPRNIRHTPFHAQHIALDAEFTASAGWEIPLWYESNAALLDEYGERVPARTGWGAKYWSRIQGAEHLAVRERVGMFDLSALAVIEIVGRDAAAFVDFVCTNRMNIDVGRVTYTLLCTPNGGIKRDMAVARRDENRYWLFTGSGTLPQEIDWLQRLKSPRTLRLCGTSPPNHFEVEIRDLSQNYGTIGLFGTHARDVLQAVTPADVSNEAFPFYSWQILEIGMAQVYAQRISYVGELGWELYVAPDTAAHVWNTLWEVGQKYSMVAAGTGAMRSMRCEKGYRLWGSDIHTEHNPYEAGMGWLVKLKKDDFVGRDALLKLKQDPLKRQWVTILIDDPSAAVTGNEPIFADGQCVGQITSGNFGYSVGKYIAFGYVPVEFSAVGTPLQIEYLSKRFTATVGNDCMFDAENARLKR